MSFALAFILLGLAVLAALAGGIWLIVLAFHRRVLWGLAVLFIPLANLVFTVIDWQHAKRPFFLSLLSLPLCLGAWFAVPKDHPFMQEIARQLVAQQAAADESPTNDSELDAPAASASSPANDEAAANEARIAALRQKEAALLARKKALDPRDQAAALALSHEIVAYNAELQDALAAQRRLGGAPLVPAATPAGGQIAGLPFTVERATLRDGILTLRQGSEFFADREVAIFLFLKNGESPVGRKWEVGAARDMSNPHVHFSWREAGQSLPKTKILMSDYRLHLEFQPGANGALTGRIALSAPGEQGSRVNGTFTAQVLAKK